jgi:hypothetical protein
MSKENEKPTEEDADFEGHRHHNGEKQLERHDDPAKDEAGEPDFEGHRFTADTKYTGEKYTGE